MEMFDKEGLVTAVVILITIVAVILVILFGWFIVWKMFLIRFSFIRELVYGGGNDKSSNNSVPATPLRRSSRIRDLRSRKLKTDD